MVTEEGVSVHEIEVALVGVWEALGQLDDVLGGVEAQEACEPAFDGVVAAVSDWLIQLDFLQSSSLVLEFVLLSKRRNEL